MRQSHVYNRRPIALTGGSGKLEVLIRQMPPAGRVLFIVHDRAMVDHVKRNVLLRYGRPALDRTRVMTQGDARLPGARATVDHILVDPRVAE